MSSLLKYFLLVCLFGSVAIFADDGPAVAEVGVGGVDEVGAGDVVVEVDQEQEQNRADQEKEENGGPDLLASSLEDMRSKMDGLIEKLRLLDTFEKEFRKGGKTASLADVRIVAREAMQEIGDVMAGVQRGQERSLEGLGEVHEMVSRYQENINTAGEENRLVLDQFKQELERNVEALKALAPQEGGGEEGAKVLKVVESIKALQEELNEKISTTPSKTGQEGEGASVDVSLVEGKFNEIKDEIRKEKMDLEDKFLARMQEILSSSSIMKGQLAELRKGDQYKKGNTGGQDAKDDELMKKIENSLKESLSVLENKASLTNSDVKDELKTTRKAVEEITGHIAETNMYMRDGKTLHTQLSTKLTSSIAQLEDQIKQIQDAQTQIVSDLSQMSSQGQNDYTLLEGIQATQRVLGHQLEDYVDKSLGYQLGVEWYRFKLALVQQWSNNTHSLRYALAHTIKDTLIPMGLVAQNQELEASKMIILSVLVLVSVGMFGIVQCLCCGPTVTRRQKVHSKLD